MTTIFRPHPNNVSTCLAAPYTAGSHTLALDAGTGVKFGTVFPLTVTVIRASTYGTPDEFSIILNATARNGDTLTISGPIEGTTDHDFVVDDRVDVRWTDGLAKTIETAVNTLETNSVSTAASYIDPPWISSLAGSKITGPVATATTAGTITGTITTSQVSNLASWPGSTAITTLGVIATGTWQGSLIAPANLGTGTPSALTRLRGDGTWFQTWNDAGVTRTANYTMTAADTFVACNCSSGALTMTLPGASGAVLNQEFIIFKTDASANLVTISRSGTDVFGGGATSLTLTGQNKYVRLIARAGAWFVVGSN